MIKICCDKTTMRRHFIAIRMAKIKLKKPLIISNGEDMEQVELSYTLMVGM